LGVLEVLRRLLQAEPAGQQATEKSLQVGSLQVDLMMGFPGDTHYSFTLYVIGIR
jgi:hypothetical protein